MEPKKQAAQLPEKRGVYMFKDAVGQVIYVGKVRSLRNRDKNRKTPGDFSR
jgi:excinuclease UvrABC nuclease subunit